REHRPQAGAAVGDGRAARLLVERRGAGVVERRPGATVVVEHREVRAALEVALRALGLAVGAIAGSALVRKVAPGPSALAPYGHQPGRARGGALDGVLRDRRLPELPELEPEDRAAVARGVAPVGR